ASHYYSDTGHIEAGPDYRRMGLSFYGEVGLGWGLELIADLDGVNRSSFGGARASTKFGDTRYGLKKSIRGGRWPVAVSVIGTAATAQHGRYPSAAQLATPGDILPAGST